MARLNVFARLPGKRSEDFTSSGIWFVTSIQRVFSLHGLVSLMARYRIATTQPLQPTRQWLKKLRHLSGLGMSFVTMATLFPRSGVAILETAANEWVALVYTF